MCEDELMNIMIAFGIASIMLLIGTFLRAKVGFLQKLLVPASIIAGVLGLAFVNLCDAFHIDIGATSGDFSSIVNQLFVVSFISITLMGHSEEDSSRRYEEHAERRSGHRPDLVYALHAYASRRRSDFHGM